MSRSEPLLGYVAKVYPRFSETFIVNEIRAREAQGERIEVFSLRPPLDGRFHETLAEVHAPVAYLRRGGLRAVELWALLRSGEQQHPTLRRYLDDLLALEAEDAADRLQMVTDLLRSELRAMNVIPSLPATEVARTRWSPN